MVSFVVGDGISIYAMAITGSRALSTPPAVTDVRHELKLVYLVGKAQESGVTGLVCADGSPAPARGWPQCRQVGLYWPLTAGCG